MYLTHSDKFDFKNVNPAARGSLASVRDELGNRRLRRSSRKGGIGGLGGGGGGRKKSLDSIQSKREFMPANPRNQSKFPATLNIQDESGYIARYIKRFHRIRKLKRFGLNPCLAGMLPNQDAGGL